jgi:hypothetical protein
MVHHSYILFTGSIVNIVITNVTEYAMLLHTVNLKPTRFHGYLSGQNVPFSHQTLWILSYLLLICIVNIF